MSTITVERPVTATTETVELALPAYRRWGKNTFYMIIAPKSAVIVKTYDFSFGIESGIYSDNATSVESVEISEAEFTAALEEVQKKIKEAVNA